MGNLRSNQLPCRQGELTEFEHIFRSDRPNKVFSAHWSVFRHDKIPIGRYVVCTDMIHDDDNSLIRLLHSANEIDIEAIIITDQGPESIRIPDWPNKMWNRAFEIID